MHITRSAIGLALLTVVPSVLSAQPVGDGPLREAIRKSRFETISRTDSGVRGKRGDWTRVIALEPGTAIHLTPTDGPPLLCRFVDADGESLRVLDPHSSLVPPAAMAELEDLLRHHAAFVPLAHTPGGIRHGSLLLSDAGLFVDGRRVAGLDEVFVRVPRWSVERIATAPVLRGSHAGSLLGGAAGAAVGLWTAFRILLSDKPCGGSCAGREALAVSAAIGFPVLGAALGYDASHHTVSRVIFP